MDEGDNVLGLSLLEVAVWVDRFEVTVMKRGCYQVRAEVNLEVDADSDQVSTRRSVTMRYDVFEEINQVFSSNLALAYQTVLG